MSGFHLMVVLVMFMVTSAAILTARYRTMQIRATARRDPEAAGLRQEVETLRDRIAVLERITVEKENSLERQIEALRDR
jgi:uncharacterized protein YlxW (UPF0749 family)